MNEQGSPADVLIVDDSEDIRDFYSMILLADGYRVRTASDGEEALRRVREQRPSAMIVDVMMPGMDGFELLAHLRSELSPPLPPVIISSGFEVTAIEAKRRGASAFLAKPVDPDDLLLALDSALKGASTNASALARADDRAKSGRRRSRLQAESSIVGRKLREPGGDRLAPWFDWLAQYFEVDTAAVVIANAGMLQVLVANAGAIIGTGEDVTNRLALCRSVVETGDVLVVSDVVTHPSFCAFADRLSGIASFVGVPLREQSGTAFGVIFIARAAAWRWSIEDVYSLETIGRHGADLLERLVRERDPGPVVHGGVLSSPLFSALLDMETRTLNRVGGVVEVAVAQLESSSAADACARSTRALPNMQRTVIGAEADRLLAFKRARDDQTAMEAIDMIVDHIRASVPVRGIGRVAVESSVRCVHPAALVDMASDVLAQDPTGAGRIVIRREPSRVAA
jgi:CheY-like chemotaxis protein